MDPGSLDLILKAMEDFDKFHAVLTSTELRVSKMYLSPAEITGLPSLSQLKILKRERHAAVKELRDKRKEVEKQLKSLRIGCHKVHEHLCFLRMKGLGEFVKENTV